MRFVPLDFSSKIPPRALLNGQKLFCIWLRIRRNILDNHLQISDSAISMRLQDWFPQFQWDRRIGSHIFNETAGLVPIFSMGPQDWFPYFQ
jgi:hypothetical protein